ncbi:rop guanine nucleotide exchange factor 3-like [Vigna umbellata]|uniref:rop guanine nucleotide exchange factor 3-like n=1 Tax=Vigna umbellata TaxID=87088 RepID=UPI001F5ED335|nr:rop guanine nucleotide exchange factor 3-like [Vigna umbellata]
MKERFAKLLPGENMSGSGKGVCNTVTISNAITNGFATVFGQSLKLEPLKSEKKAMWKREMKVLLSVCGYIQEFAPTAYLKDDEKQAIEILATFQDTEFWCAENIPGNFNCGASFRRIVPRKDDKWWLSVPCVLPGGVSDVSRKHLIEKRVGANQIHKAAMAINSNVLEEIDIPETYIDNLPKVGLHSRCLR